MLYIKQYPILNFQDIRQDVLYSGFSNNKLL